MISNVHKPQKYGLLFFWYQNLKIQLSEYFRAFYVKCKGLHKLNQIFDEIDQKAEVGEFTQDEAEQEDQEVEQEEI